MPYIKQERRRELDFWLKGLGESLNSEGELNYAITKLVDHFFRSGSYVQLSAGMGVLSCVASEFYRRRVVPFEEQKRIENGDVFEC